MKNFESRTVSTGEKGLVAKAQYLALAVLAMSAPVLTGCASSKRYSDLPAFSAYDIYDSENQSVGRFKTSYLADQIHAYFRGNAAGPVAVATFVDLDNLYGTSTFGRVLGEQMISELAMKGYNVREIRQSEALQIMYDQGEFGLSRDLKQLRQAQDLSGIIVGTYTVSPVRIYVNARLIDPNSALVLSAASVEMPKTQEIAKMLRNNSLPTSMERIPVRNVAFANYPLPYYWPAPKLLRFRDPEEDEPVSDSFELKLKADKHANQLPPVKVAPPEPKLGS